MKESIRKNPTKEHALRGNYLRIMVPFGFFGIYQLVGVGIYGWGMMRGLGTLDIIWSRLYIRIGEFCAQSHSSFSVLFFHMLKKFKFPFQERKLIEHIPMPEKDTRLLEDVPTVLI
jgi:hypothetical protein